MLLDILYKSEKKSYGQLSEIMLKVARMGSEMNVLMEVVSKNIDESKEKLADNLGKILKW